MLDNARRVRLIGAAVIATLLVGTTVGAEAATKKKVVKHTRTVTLPYTGGCTLEVNVAGNGGAASPGQCNSYGGANWSLSAKTGEKYVTVTVTDATGQKVPGQFWVKGSSLGHDTEIPFCGAMKDYKFPTPDLLLDVDAVGALNTCPGVATQGKVTLVFSNLP